MKVFSLEKFKKTCKEFGYTEESLNASVKAWAGMCDGRRIVVDDDGYRYIFGTTFGSHPRWEEDV